MLPLFSNKNSKVQNESFREHGFWTNEDVLNSEMYSMFLLFELFEKNMLLRNSLTIIKKGFVLQTLCLYLQ